MIRSLLRLFCWSPALRTAACLLAPIAASASAQPSGEAPPRDPALVVVGAGIAGVLDSTRVGTGFAEYRFGSSWKGVHPWVSITMGSHARYYVAAGALYSFELDRNWRITLSFGPGFYHSRDNFDLGSELEFLSTAEVSRRLPWNHRLGLSFGHISNGGVAEVNPGSEIVKLNYQIPWPGTKRSHPR